LRMPPAVACGKRVCVLSYPILPSFAQFEELQRKYLYNICPSRASSSATRGGTRGRGRGTWPASADCDNSISFFALISQAAAGGAIVSCAPETKKVPAQPCSDRSCLWRRSCPRISSFNRFRITRRKQQRLWSLPPAEGQGQAGLFVGRRRREKREERKE
jgi:hypothetical protein